MVSSRQSQEPEPEFDTETRHDSPASSGGELARFDEVMQQRIIALAGQLQDHERSTVSLTQLEAVADEVGLEPRFVREAARRLVAQEAALPKQLLPIVSASTPLQSSLSSATRALSQEESATPQLLERQPKEEQLPVVKAAAPVTARARKSTGKLVSTFAVFWALLGGVLIHFFGQVGLGVVFLVLSAFAAVMAAATLYSANDEKTIQ